MTRVLAVDGNNSIDITDYVKACYDIATSSMDHGSGFLDNEEMVSLVLIARAIGAPDAAGEQAYLAAQANRPEITGWGEQELATYHAELREENRVQREAREARDAETARRWAEGAPARAVAQAERDEAYRVAMAARVVTLRVARERGIVTPLTGASAQEAVTSALQAMRDEGYPV